MRLLIVLLKRAWILPCSCIGLLVAGVVLLLGGRMARGPGVLEFSLHECRAECGRLAAGLPYRAITLGQIIVAVTREDLAACRAHELAHVRQYQRWGLAFFPAYLASSLWQWLRGGAAYRDNCFEVQARIESGEEKARGQ